MLQSFYIKIPIIIKEKIYRFIFSEEVWTCSPFAYSCQYSTTKFSLLQIHLLFNAWYTKLEGTPSSNILNLFRNTTSIHSYNTQSSSANKFYIKKSRFSCVPKLDVRVFRVEFFALTGQRPFLQTVLLVCSTLQILYSTIRTIITPHSSVHDNYILPLQLYCTVHLNSTSPTQLYFTLPSQIDSTIYNTQ